MYVGRRRARRRDHPGRVSRGACRSRCARRDARLGFGGGAVPGLSARVRATETATAWATCAGSLGRLDHLAGQSDSLGVDAIWLSPFYPHGGVDGGYDVTDFTDVSPEFGSLADLDALVAACHERGVRVLLDLVTGPFLGPPPVVRVGAFRPDQPAPRLVPVGRCPPGRQPAEQLGFRVRWVGLDRRSRAASRTSTRSTPSSPISTGGTRPSGRRWATPCASGSIAGVDGFRVDAIEFLIKDARLRDNPPAGPVAASVVPRAGRAPTAMDAEPAGAWGCAAGTAAERHRRVSRPGAARRAVCPRQPGGRDA